MVKRSPDLNAVFRCLADPTRRDILRRVSHKEFSITNIAAGYERQMSLAAVSKHLRVLEGARLVRKRREGRQHLVSLSLPALKEGARYFENYKKTWEERLDRLEAYVAKKK